MEMISESKYRELEQFLSDVRDHFRASLETSEYENTSNLFHVTEAEATEKLLQRCEQLLECCTAFYRIEVNKPMMTNETITITNANTNGNCTINKLTSSENKEIKEHDDVSYLDMTVTNKNCSSEYADLSNSVDSDKTFRCSTQLKKDSIIDEIRIHQFENNSYNDEDTDPEIYDTCDISHLRANHTLPKTITPDLDPIHTLDCPYINLPAQNMIMQKPSKYGQLQRIEKRLFFDQSKKCYCGILNEWLLCYIDGPTSTHPSITLHLRTSGIEIEHFGEGKRRDICFQITTGDQNKKFIFQANNEVDAKEWIHAIEAAIRGDNNTLSTKTTTRKLPTPPVIKKIDFNNDNGSGSTSGRSSQGDCIYEEPKRFYNINKTEIQLNSDIKTTEQDINALLEYDIPKCPAKPLHKHPESLQTQTEVEITNLINLNDHKNISPSSQNSIPIINVQTVSTKCSPKLEISDFQTKIKDVHNKLSSQLLLCSNQERLKKAVKKTYSSSSNESEIVALTTTTTTPTSGKDQKKQKKSNTPNASPQKNQNLNSTPNNNIHINLGTEKSTKNWFMNRLNKSTLSVRNSASPITPTKCKQSEKENLLNGLDVCDNVEPPDSASNSPILKSNGKSKVNMIINQFEASGHLAMFSVETLAGQAMATINSIYEHDCNNYEPISMTVSTPQPNFMKKV